MQEKDDTPGTCSVPSIKIAVKAESDKDEVTVEMTLVPTFPCRLTVEIASRRAIDLQEIPPHKAFRLRDKVQDEDSIDLFISPVSVEDACGDVQDSATIFFVVLLKTLALIRCNGFDTLGIALEITINNLRIFFRR